MNVTQSIADAATANGVDPALAIEVATAESSLNPNTPDSSAGAIGLFQLMPATAAQMGVDPRDPVQNIQGGVRYLRQLLSQFPDVSQALAAYNWGPGNVSSAVSQFGQDWLATAPSETQLYVTKILNALGTQYQVSVGVPPSDTGAVRAGIQMMPSALPSLSTLGWIILAGIGLFALWAVER